MSTRLILAFHSHTVFRLCSSVNVDLHQYLPCRFSTTFGLTQVDVEKLLRKVLEHKGKPVDEGELTDHLNYLKEEFDGYCFSHIAKAQVYRTDLVLEYALVSVYTRVRKVTGGRKKEKKREE